MSDETAEPFTAVTIIDPVRGAGISDEWIAMHREYGVVCDGEIAATPHRPAPMSSTWWLVSS